MHKATKASSDVTVALSHVQIHPSFSFPIFCKAVKENMGPKARLIICSSLPQAFFVLVSLSALCSKEKKWDQYLTYGSDQVCLV